MINTKHKEDSEIISEYIKTGSNESANLLIRKYSQFVYAIAFRYVGNYDDATEISQDTFIKVLDSLAKFKGKSSFKSWLYRITANMAINKHRKNKLSNLFIRSDNPEFDAISDKNPPADKNVDLKLFQNDFNVVLAKLPTKQRETFALKYFENMTYEEISEILGTSVGGLKANYFQAIKKLAEHLKDYKEIIR